MLIDYSLDGFKIKIIINFLPWCSLPITCDLNLSNLVPDNEAKFGGKLKKIPTVSFREYGQEIRAMTSLRPPLFMATPFFYNYYIPSNFCRYIKVYVFKSSSKINLNIKPFTVAFNFGQFWWELRHSNKNNGKR